MTDYAGPTAAENRKYKDANENITSSHQLEQLAGDIESLFDDADRKMIEESDYAGAVSDHSSITVTQREIYEQIISVDPDNVDALHSVATCIKHTTNSFEQQLHYLKRALAVSITSTNDWQIEP